MVFNITISFNGLKSKKGKDYAIMLADTVIVKPTGPEVLTAKIPRKYEEISYALEGDQPEEENKKKPTTAKPVERQARKKNIF